MTDSPTEPKIDKADADAFQKRMFGLVNDGGLALSVSIGHRTGLYDTMASLPPSTSTEIAEAAGLNERYVREWLGAMVTGGIVDYHPPIGAYSLPAERAASLTRAAGPGNLASLTQFIALLGQVETKIVDCVQNGGGVPYSEYPEFHALMREISGATFDATLIPVTLPLVEGLPEQLEAGIDVADIGCGAGHAVCVMAEAYPKSTFVGFDFSEEAIAMARDEAEEKGLSNARFQVADASQLDGSYQADLVTVFDAVHDQAQPAAMLDSVFRTLKPGGTFLCVDVAASSHVGENIDHLLGPFMYTVSCMHCMSVSLAYEGVGLGAMWGVQKARAMFADAGFVGLEVKKVEGDMINNYYITKRPALPRTTTGATREQ